MPLRVLVTGAWGTLGRETVLRLLRSGHHVIALDLPSRSNQRRARQLAVRASDAQTSAKAGDRPQSEGGRLSNVFVDLRDEAALKATLSSLRLDGSIDAIVHLAAMLPPHSEVNVARCEEVNVGGTRHLLDIAQAQEGACRFFFASSVSVYGPEHGDELLGSQDATVATDAYTRTKLAAEQLVRSSGLRWTIARVGVAIAAFDSKASVANIRTLLRVHPDVPLELVHPRDVATAVHNWLHCDEASEKVLLLGGGPSCRIRTRDLWALTLDAAGIGTLADAELGQERYYTGWLDSAPANALLKFQDHGAGEIRAELTRAYAQLRWIIRPLAPLIRMWFRRQARRLRHPKGQA